MDRCIQALATMAVVLLTSCMEVRAADVPHISGGELLAKEKEYNLKIIAAEKSGDYLANVKVVIVYVPGASLARRIGPSIVVSSTGSFPADSIRATSDGQMLTRTVTIPARGLRQVDFRWGISK